MNTAAKVNFGEDSFYSAGSSIPEGDYALWFEFTMHTPTNQQGQVTGQPRLGVNLTAVPLGEPNAQTLNKFISMGTNSHKSFMPNADDEGKSLVLVPNAAGSSVTDKSNWNYFRKSMLDCGLPVGVLSDDLRVIDGVWVHLQNVPEPEERKSFAKTAATGEAQQTEEKRNNTMPVVSEIKDDGKPWEGTGGMPEVAAKPAKPGPKGVVKPAAKPGPVAAKPGPAKAPVAAPAVDSEDVATAAIAAVSTVLEASPHGTTKLLLRTSTFKEAQKTDEAMAQAVIDTYFNNDTNLNGLLGQLGYAVAGAKVVPQAG